MAYAIERTPAERSIIYGMALNGASLDAINVALQAGGSRELPESSYRSIVKDYVPYFQADINRLGPAILNPPTWSDLKAA
jgi:hypothetical protein